MKSFPFTVLLCAFLAFASTLRSAAVPPGDSLQGPPRHPSGLVVGTPIAVTTNADPHVQIKLAGFDPIAPTTWPRRYPRPRFEHLVQSILAGFGGQATVSPILAMSTGLDVVVVADLELKKGMKLDGKLLDKNENVTLLKIPPPGWYAIQFAVEGGLLRAGDDLAPDINGAKIRGQVSRSVFSFALPGGTAVRLPEEAESVRCLAPDDLGLSGNDEVHGVDFHAAMYYSNLMLFQAAFTPRHLPEVLDVFFTLRGEFLAAVTPETLRSTWKVSTADSGTIYVTTWNNGAWSTPKVYRTWNDLGLPEGPGILDGLAIDSGEKRSPGVGAYDDDKILFSTGGQYEQLAVATQMQFVAYASKQPKKVVIELPNSEYGSLATRMRAGKAVGDFCTSDPWGIPIDIELAEAEARLRAQAGIPEGAREGESRAVHTESQEQGATSLPNAIAAKYRALFHTEHLPDDFFIARRYAYDKDKDVAPTLAIAAYRHQVGAVPHMRGCISYPVRGAKGHAKIYWGHTGDITENPMRVNWLSPVEVDYEDAPLVFDKPMENNGLLQDPPNSDPIPTAAYLLKWELVVDGRTYYSPVAALRY